MKYGEKTCTILDVLEKQQSYCEPCIQFYNLESVPKSGKTMIVSCIFCMLFKSV